MHDGMPYGWNQGQGQGHSREVDRQSPTGLIFVVTAAVAVVIMAPRPQTLQCGAEGTRGPFAAGKKINFSTRL